MRLQQGFSHVALAAVDIATDRGIDIDVTVIAMGGGHWRATSTERVERMCVRAPMRSPDVDRPTAATPHAACEAALNPPRQAHLVDVLPAA